jgi:hypothetical protein
MNTALNPFVTRLKVLERWTPSQAPNSHTHPLVIFNLFNNSSIIPSSPFCEYLFLAMFYRKYSNKDPAYKYI